MIFKASIRLMAIVLLLSFLMMAAPAPKPSSGATLEEKQAEADRVKQQIDSMKAEGQRLASEYNAALDQYEAVQAEVNENKNQLERAQSDYKKARTILNERLRSIYESGDINSMEIGRASCRERV